MRKLSLLLFLLCFGSAYGNKSEQTDTIVQLSRIEMFRIAAKRADSLFWANPENVEKIRQIYEDVAKIREIHKNLLDSAEIRSKEYENLKLQLWKQQSKRRRNFYK
jgi:hypothetical protein